MSQPLFVLMLLARYFQVFSQDVAACKGGDDKRPPPRTFAVPGSGKNVNLTRNLQLEYKHRTNGGHRKHCRCAPLQART